jgi:hypothetical protein
LPRFLFELALDMKLNTDKHVLPPGEYEIELAVVPRKRRLDAVDCQPLVGCYGGRPSTAQCEDERVEGEAGLSESSR